MMKSMAMKMDMESPSAKEYYPSLVISKKTMPEITDIKPGDEVEIKICCKVKSCREDEISCDVIKAECCESEDDDEPIDEETVKKALEAVKKLRKS